MILTAAALLNRAAGVSSHHGVHIDQPNQYTRLDKRKH
jgi:hypothetical protein